MTPSQIRQAWSDFWEEKAPADRKHAHLPAASLIVNAADDPTTLFNSAGMQQVVPYLMGKKHASGDKLYNIQGCVRTGDLEEVGDASHLSYFEMMGNRSLGSYFKQESVARSWEFLTTVLNLDPRKIAVTVFEGDDNAPRDEETAQYWRDQGVADNRISYLGVNDNRRGPAGATGPCGPDTEIFYWIGDGEFPPESSNVQDDEDNWMEIRNNVFMAYYKDADGNYTPLEQKNVDTGMGFERISLVMQSIADQKDIREMSVYDTAMFTGVLGVVGALAGKQYQNVAGQQLRDFRVVADHSRASSMLIAEGLAPSNEGRGYVLRKLIRRMYFHLQSVGSDGLVTSTKRATVLKSIVDSFVGEYEILEREYDRVTTVLIQEVEGFVRTLNQGAKKLEEMLGESSALSGEKAFVLYDTYGLPLEVTTELVSQHGGVVDVDGFEDAMQAARERSRAGGGKFNKATDRAAFVEGLPETVFVGYETFETDATLLKDEIVDGNRVVVFDKTSFYAESGGQCGDHGSIVFDDATSLRIIDTQSYGGVQLHIVE